MNEKLDRLRAEVERWRKKVEDDKAKLKAAEEKLKEAEDIQILADVRALNLSPEQLSEFLKLVTAAKPGSDVYDGRNTKDTENESEENVDEED